MKKYKVYIDNKQKSLYLFCMYIELVIILGDIRITKYKYLIIDYNMYT